MQQLSSFLGCCQHSLLNFLYPPHCLHCKESIQSEETLLCFSCASLLELIDPEERCPFCFGKDYAPASKHCGSCVHGERLFYRMGSVFDYRGPAASLVKRLKYGNQPYLAKGLGSFLAVQFDQFKWRVPDAIVPVPLSFTHWLERGYNQSDLLAKELANYMQVPVWDVLKRKSGDYSQAGLDLAQRKNLAGASFSLKEGFQLQDKTILVIDDTMATGSTLQRCAEALAEGCPSRLYAMTVCCA